MLRAIALAALALPGCTLIYSEGRALGSGDAAFAADAGGSADSGLDAGSDAGLDAGSDAGLDAGSDAGLDAGSDAGHDGGSDGGLLLGDTVVESNTDPHSAGLADSSNFVAIQSGTVATLSAFYDSGDVSELDIGLYDDSGGNPNALLTVAKIVNPVPGTWVSGPVSPTVQVVAGTTYWLALLGPFGDGNTFRFRYGTGAGGATTTQHSQASNLAALPTAWTTGANFPGTFCSFYASQ